jgi:hypothetical protein
MPMPWTLQLVKLGSRRGAGYMATNTFVPARDSSLYEVQRGHEAWNSSTDIDWYEIDSNSPHIHDSQVATTVLLCLMRPSLPSITCVVAQLVMTTCRRAAVKAAGRSSVTISCSMQPTAQIIFLASEARIHSSGKATVACACNCKCGSIRAELAAQVPRPASVGTADCSSAGTERGN